MSKLVKIYQPLYACKGKGPWLSLGTFLNKKEAEKVDLKGKGLNGGDGILQDYNAAFIDGKYYILEDRYGKIPRDIKVQE